MTGLPSSIVKKYGIGKKAWAVYRSSGTGRVRRSAPMARKRKRSSSAFGKARRRVRSFTAGRSGPATLTEIGMMGAYGYFRSDVVSFAAPAINMVPAGDYSDNVTLGLGAYAVSYFLKPSNAYVKQALRTVVLSEAFIAGAKMRRGASLTTTSSTAQASGEYL